MQMMTRAELAAIRARLAREPAAVGNDRELITRLIAQSEYALDCAALLEEARSTPAEPYSDACALVARINDGFNEIWNRYRYLGARG
ncbi:MAG TPA: hypothetical protein VEC57_19085 [Candidatus Limnocylindrales bacterium]|nr:hypothetical protein [Candidatus Limnocylindrales bacterium]